MRILLFGNYHGGKQFYDELSEWLTKVGFKVDLFDWGSVQLFIDDFKTKIIYKPSLPIRLLTKIPSSKVQLFSKNQFRKKALKSITNDYDIINIHYGNANNNKFLCILKKKGRKTVVTLWGSDFHRVPDELRQKARKLYDNVDIIHIANPEVQKDFVNYYNDYENKTGWNKVGFGDNKLQRIDEIINSEKREITRSLVGLPQNCFVITCGYKAYHVLQHHLIIDAIEKIKDILPKNYVLVFPLTYHRNEEYVSQIKQRLKESDLYFKSFDEFLTEDEISRIRISSDIYITIPETDGASSSLLEYLTAGNIVIAGEWLPYQLHKSMGLYFHTTSMDDLANKIKEVVLNFEEFKEQAKINKTIILDNFSWPVRIKEWQMMFESLINN